VVVPANLNSSSQIVVSGDIDAVKKYAVLAKEAGAKRAVLLEVGGAFHSPLMESARSGLEEYLSTITIKTPSRPVIANVTAQPVEDPDQIRQLLVRQVTSPVRWGQTMSWLSDNSVTGLIEVGPGKVLAGLAKREMKPEISVNLDKLEDISGLDVLL